jgi:uroporphyrin-III C-methyltransferase
MRPGLVSLVGAGPGDPGLLTRRGARRLRQADVVVYDRLVAPALLALARPAAARVFVGKARGRHAMAQAEINALLIREARQGRRVVRLKGGDPFVLGRGGEEALALAAAGLRWEVVPGVSSAVAVPAAAGIPVTHRGVAASFAVVSGHGAGGVDWRRLARGADTLVVLMGLAELHRIAAALVGAGRAPSTPVAVIASGTTPRQTVVTGTLADIARRAAAAGLEAPAAIVVGAVVTLRRRLGRRRRSAVPRACPAAAAAVP